MMSLRAFLALLLIYIVYLIIGGFTFKATEQVIIIHSLCFASIVNWNLQAKANDDFHRMKSNRQNLTSKIGKLKGSLHEDQMDLFEDMMNVLNETLPDEPCTPIPSWDFFNSLFFSFTAVTTIGKFHSGWGDSTSLRCYIKISKSSEIRIFVKEFSSNRRKICSSNGRKFALRQFLRFPEDSFF